MSEKKVMLFWLKYWISQSRKDGKDYQETKAYKAIRSLIKNMDKKPTVTKEWLNQLAINLIMATPKVKGKDLAMTALHALVVNELKNELTAQGIEVVEGGKDERDNEWGNIKQIKRLEKENTKRPACLLDLV